VAIFLGENFRELSQGGRSRDCRKGLGYRRYASTTCATLLLTRNVHPKQVQELLGHATVAITLDTYSHVIPGMGDHTARAMEDVFS